MKFTVTGMAGAIKALDSRLLDGAVGANSVNQRPLAGELSPWREPLTVASVQANQRCIYRMGRDVASDSDYWLTWPHQVHVVRGFLANDTTERTYVTGAGTPKVTDNTMGLATAPYPSAARELGVPKPSGLSIVTVSARPATGENRITNYADAFVTDRGEESAPRLIGEATCPPGSTVTITGLPAAPVGNYGITTRRIYRLEVGESGEAEFFFLKDIASTLTSVTDAGEEVGALMMVTATWTPPPADLKCLTGMWSGIMAGISGRSVRYCEPYKPYAWPLAYETLPPDVTPVALGVWGSTLLVLTNGQPYAVTGSLPSSMSDGPIEMGKSCLSAASVCNIEHGIVWASGDGLAYYGARGPQLLTDGILTRDQWLALAPETMVGTFYEGIYLGFYRLDGQWKGFAIDPTEPRGIYFLDKGYPAAYLDKLRDSVYVLDGTSIKKWDAGAAFMAASFTSKTYRSPKPILIGACEVVARTYPVTVKVWGDGVLRDTRTVNSDEPVTLRPTGAQAREWRFEVATSGAVLGASFATSLRALRDE